MKKDFINDSIITTQAILDELPIMIWATNAKGYCSYVNKEWLIFAGSTPEQEAGYGWAERVHYDDFEKLIIAIDSAYESRDVFEFMFRILNQEGKYRWLKAKGTPFLEKNGELLGYIGFGYDVTVLKEAQEAYRQTEKKYASLFNGNSEVILVIDPKTGIIIDANPAACTFYGYTKQEILAKKIKDINLFPEEQVLTAINSVAIGASKSFSFQHRIANGEIRDVESFVGAFILNEKKFVYSIVHDITSRKMVERKIEQAHAELQQIFNSTADGMRVVDLNFNIIRVNQKLLSMLGINSNEALGKKCYELFPNSYCKTSMCSLKRVIQGENYIEYEANTKLKDGTIIPCSIIATPFCDAEGNLIGMVESLRDMTNRKKYEEKINFLAFHDSLTGLPNRAWFNEQLKATLTKAKKKKLKFAVMFLDLDEFKSVNDTLGHTAGDKLLVEVANRLQKITGKVKAVCRFGGDEFILMISNLGAESEVIETAKEILQTFQTPFYVNNHEIFTSTSIGISLFPKDGAAAETLINKADKAMYKAKEQGKNSYVSYAQEQSSLSLNRMKLINNLRRAVEQNELEVFYQPQLKAWTKELVGVEALARWKHRELGLLPPHEFIPLAEQTGLIVPLSEQVLYEACMQNKAWQDKGLPPIRVAVNISARQFQHKDFLAIVTKILEKTGLNSKFLELEITESIAIDNSNHNLELLKKLKALGLRISLDDFGTGYSSLSYLSVNPIDVIKIDKTFLKDLKTNPNNKAIISAIIAMAKSLKLEVTAEGVECEEHVAFLSGKKCDYLQGYYFGKPMPREEFEVFYQHFNSKPI